jgi:DNA-binding LytR/AlgR family response regulator
MKRILVIEDDYNVRSSIRELLEANNYEVFSASDGIEGVQLAKQVTPDLIICDIMMPKLDGYEVFENLKKEPIFNSIPFIYLTAKSEIGDIRNGMEQGADDYITKPFRALNLLKAIEGRLERFKSIQSQQPITKNENDEIKKERLTEEGRLFINEKNKPHIIRVGDISWIKAEGEYSSVCTINGMKFFVRKLIKQWEQQLPENIFLRIHRSTIINLSLIDKIEKWSHRSYIILLKNTDEKFIVSQRYAKKIKSILLI